MASVSGSRFVDRANRQSVADCMTHQIGAANKALQTKAALEKMSGSGTLAG